jgi:predicted SAM-dependent methyltransferase
VFPLTREAADLGDQKFDAITVWDVMEHVVDPTKIMKTCRELLKPGGCLFVNVPDLDSLQAILLGKRWPLLLPEHLTYDAVFRTLWFRECGPAEILVKRAAFFR